MLELVDKNSFLDELESISECTVFREQFFGKQFILMASFTFFEA